MSSTRIFNTLIAVFFLLLFQSCKDVKEPVFEEIENLKLGKVDLTSTTLSANVRFNNPNKFELQLKSIDCDVFVDSTYLGHFVNAEPIRIPARQPFRLPVLGEVQTMKLMQYSKRAFLQEPSPIRIEGKARVGRAGFFKTIPFTYADTVLIKF